MSLFLLPWIRGSLPVNGEWLRGNREAAGECSKNDDKEPDFSGGSATPVQLLLLPDSQKIFDEEARGDARRVCTQAPAIVLLILQRPRGGLSLSAVGQQLPAHHRDLLTVNRRVEDQTLPENK
jgi:hypothetical protein